MDERDRKFSRSGTRLNLSYVIVGTKKLGQALTKDVGAGGIGFTAEHHLELGTKLEIMLHLPERAEPVRFLAEVVWSQTVKGDADKTLGMSGSEVGVRVAEIDPKDRTLLVQYTSMFGPPPPPESP